MTQEQLVIIAYTPVARILKKLQFFTKDPGSGTVFLLLLPISQAFLLLKKSARVFIKIVSELVSAALLRSPYLV